MEYGERPRERESGDEEKNKTKNKAELVRLEKIMLVAPRCFIMKNRKKKLVVRNLSLILSIS
jgi:hypothetical protein